MKWTKQKLNNLFFFLGIAAVVVMLLTFDVSFIESNYGTICAMQVIG